MSFQFLKAGFLRLGKTCAFGFNRCINYHLLVLFLTRFWTFLFHICSDSTDKLVVILRVIKTDTLEREIYDPLYDPKQNNGNITVPKSELTAR